MSTRKDKLRIKIQYNTDFDLRIKKSLLYQVLSSSCSSWSASCSTGPPGCPGCPGFRISSRCLGRFSWSAYSSIHCFGMHLCAKVCIQTHTVHAYVWFLLVLPSSCLFMYFHCVIKMQCNFSFGGKRGLPGGGLMTCLLQPNSFMYRCSANCRSSKLSSQPSEHVVRVR